MLAQGKTLPAVAVGEQLKQQRPEVYERTDQAGNKSRVTDQDILDQSFTRHIKTDQEVKQIGTSQHDIDADHQLNIGGNQTVNVIGNIQQVTASNQSLGVAGTLQEHVQGVAQRISETKNRLVAPLSYMGSEGQNIFRILEEIIQILADLASTTASHTHNGGPTPDQSNTFSGQSSQATAEKAKLTPIIE